MFSLVGYHTETGRHRRYDQSIAFDAAIFNALARGRVGTIAGRRHPPPRFDHEDTPAKSNTRGEALSLAREASHGTWERTRPSGLAQRGSVASSIPNWVVCKNDECSLAPIEPITLGNMSGAGVRERHQVPGTPDSRPQSGEGGLRKNGIAAAAVKRHAIMAPSTPILRPADL
jgi:hypothetical protein